jgi:hypothetical protein
LALQDSDDYQKHEIGRDRRIQNTLLTEPIRKRAGKILSPIRTMMDVARPRGCTKIGTDLDQLGRPPPPSLAPLSFGFTR